MDPQGDGHVIYLDNHASTPLDPAVAEAMTPYWATHFANPHATEHAEGWRAHAAVEAAATKISTAIGADADEIIFTSGATEANNLAILGLSRRAPTSKRRILVSAIEHKCVLSAARAMEPSGFRVEVIPVDNFGFIDVEDLERRLRDDVLLVSVMAVNNEIGTIQDIPAIASVCKRARAYLHTDAVQALACGPIDVSSWDVDALSLSGHKIYGPKGIGALFIRRQMQSCVEPLLYGGDQQNGLRAGTLPVPLCVGLAAAVDAVTAANAASERARLRALRDDFVETLKLTDGSLRLNGPTGELRHPGNANLRFSGIDARDLLAALQPRVAASTGSACSSGIPEPSHVLRAIGLSGPEAESSVRFSLGRFTSHSDLMEAAKCIREAVSAIRSVH